MYQDYPPRHTGQKRFFLVTGVLGVVLGLALVGAAVYAIFLRSGSDDALPYAIPVRRDPSPAVVGSGPIVGQKYNLLIEKLGVDAPVGVFGLDENQVPEVPFDPGIVAWYNFSAEPGNGGNAVFAGHRTWRGDAVFRHLDELGNGDRITLRSEGGVELVYEVFHSELVDPSNDSATSWMLPTDYDVVTLITCGGEYRKNNDPIFGAEYSGRQVVRAALVQ